MTLKSSKSWPPPFVQLRVDSANNGLTYHTYAAAADGQPRHVTVNVTNHKRLKDDIRRWNRGGYTRHNRLYNPATFRTPRVSPFLKPNVIVTDCQTHCDSNGRAIPSTGFISQRENGDCKLNKIEFNNSKTGSNIHNDIAYHQEQLSIQTSKKGKALRNDEGECSIKTTQFRPPVLRTDTVSTILEQEMETDDVDNSDNTNHYYDDLPTIMQNTSASSNHHLLTCHQQPSPGTTTVTLPDRYHVLALARIDEHHEQQHTKRTNDLLYHPREVLSSSATRTTAQSSEMLYHQRRRSCEIFVNDEKTLICQVHQKKGVLSMPISCGDGGVCNCDKTQQLKIKQQDAVGTMLDQKKVMTLKRHYYTEGGWGWIIIACTILVHILNHGIQLSCALLVIPGAEKFKTRPVHVAGM